ncbi:MAG: hypothetical protein ACI9BK_001649, partial [Acidimicrobiales bacterium]
FDRFCREFASSGVTTHHCVRRDCLASLFIELIRAGIKHLNRCRTTLITRQPISWRYQACSGSAQRGCDQFLDVIPHATIIAQILTTPNLLRLNR